LCSPTTAWAFDYVSLHGNEEHPHRVLGIGVTPAQLDRVRQACTAADLKLQRLVPEPLGWLELSGRISEEPGAQAASISVFAALAGRQAAVWATQDGALRLVRTVWLPAEPDPAGDTASLAGELRRTLLSLSQMAEAPSATLPCIYCGENAVTIARQLSESLGRPVRGVRLEDMVEAPAEDLSEVAPLAALGASMAANRPSAMDMLHPHRAPAPPSRRRTFTLAGVAAACVAAALAWTGYRQIQAPLEQAAADDAARAEMDGQLKKFEAVEKKAGAVDKWLGESVNLLTELDFLSQQLRPKKLDDKEFNSGEDLVLTKLTLAGRKITIDGAARSTDALAPIELRLRAANYRVERGALESQSESTPGYAAHVSAILQRDDKAAGPAAKGSTTATTAPSATGGSGSSPSPKPGTDGATNPHRSPGKTPRRRTRRMTARKTNPERLLLAKAALRRQSRKRRQRRRQPPRRH
jgi:Tfp pilus assembly protein PilN